MLSLCKKSVQSVLDISDCEHVRLMFKTAGNDGFFSEELKDNLKQTETQRNIWQQHCTLTMNDSCSILEPDIKDYFMCKSFLQNISMSNWQVKWPSGTLSTVLILMNSNKSKDQITYQTLHFNTVIYQVFKYFLWLYLK